jgi:hypothetical protein
MVHHLDLYAITYPTPEDRTIPEIYLRDISYQSNFHPFEHPTADSHASKIPRSRILRSSQNHPTPFLLNPTLHASRVFRNHLSSKTPHHASPPRLRHTTNSSSRQQSPHLARNHISQHSPVIQGSCMRAASRLHEVRSTVCVVKVCCIL